MKATKKQFYHFPGRSNDEYKDLIRFNSGSDPWAILLEAMTLLRVWGQSEGPDPLAETRDFLISFDPASQED